MFRQRVASSLVGIPIVLAVTWIGGLPFALLIGVIGAAALREFYQLTGVDARDLRSLGYAGHFLLLLLALQFGMQAYYAGLVGLFLVVNVFWILFFPRSFLAPAFLLWGKVYITTLLSFFLLLRGADNGLSAVMAVLLAVWASDSGAYLVGITLGRRKLLPAVSPKKSVEGAVGGVAFSALVLLAAGPYLGLEGLLAVTFGIILSVAGQAGDLAESALKRWGNTKDSGSFLPGHGGVLDRLDSLLFAVPVGYLFFQILIWQGGRL
ncbi:MAG: phosphatidate cytidylyltransferase [Bacillota bacterium]|nr:phosphatidate cytidylyltransferase [Bacillota bacterium]MDW7682542.1 phosphatidate cytidylyltransferase [Bacillota bacterium]